MENTNTYTRSKKPYFNNINFIFVGLLVLGAFIIFSFGGNNKISEYKSEMKSNETQIKIFSEEKEKAITKQKEIYEAHKKEVAEYDRKISELKKKNDALVILIGEQIDGIVPSANAQTNWRTKEFSDWCYKNLGITEINKASETAHKMCSVEGSNDFYKEEYLKTLNGNGTPTSAEPPSEQGASEVIRDVSASVEQVEGLRMMDMFGLNGCRFTNEKHYIPRINADWYGYDYACIRGKSFSVGTPSDGWTIEKIGFDRNMGNYVILKKNNFRIGFGHMVTSRKVGEKLNKSDVVGQTDLSGASSGMHIHIELWDGPNNVSYEYLLGKPYKSKRVDSLLNDRGFDFGQNSEKISEKKSSHTREDVYKISAPLVKKWEGLHLKAYWDYRQWTNGYGTTAKYANEVITQEEAEKRFDEYMYSRIDKTMKDFPNLTARQQAGMASLLYNCPSGYNAMRKQGMHMFHSYCKSAGGKRLQGLVNRRADEATYIFN